MGSKTLNMQSLFEELELGVENKEEWKITQFSANEEFPQKARITLENKYWNITEITERFNRQSVSFQLSKKDKLHSWLKYKEGFSAELVRILINEFDIDKGATILDPFMGSGTTALVACMNGINSIGYDILPMSKISINAKSDVNNYNIKELLHILNDLTNLEVTKDYSTQTPTVSITKDGYPIDTAIEISYINDYIQSSSYSNNAKNLIKLCMINCLEKVSYSAKDGQYLRWDYRCPKIVKATEDRVRLGKKPFVVKLDKGKLPTMKEALIDEFSKIIDDIKEIQRNKNGNIFGANTFIEGSALYHLPILEDNMINAVISSPPYCNRYDYTRTYAMELAFLGVNDDGIRTLRQELLSCTVENKTKVERLKDFYESSGFISRFNSIIEIVQSNNVLKEIVSALNSRNAKGEINNKGVIRMVEGYFTELTFIFAELFRVCKSGAKVAFVNDNVRYAGEVIPVDYLTTMLAEQIGFIPLKIYSLKQKKGNSSQQMKKYGKVSLRKSITIWEKP